MDQITLRRFGGGLDETAILPFTIVLLVVAGILILTLPKRYAVIPFLIASLTIPLGQVVVVAGLHFLVFRILIVVGWIRIVASKLTGADEERFVLNRVDWAVLWWAGTTTVAFLLLYLDPGAVVNRLGFLFNVIGGYFLLRLLIRTWEDADRVIKCLAALCVVTAAFMVLEQRTGRNLFSIFGGVDAITPIREGKLRSQGPFAHAIIAGTIGATALPLFLSLWWAPKGKKYAIVGSVAALTMALTSSSATPVMAIGLTALAVPFWLFRRQMKWVRRLIVLCLVGLQMVMKAPVWALIARIEVIGGSSGGHRYLLIDRTIRNLGDWWLLGAKETASWGWMMQDTADQFVTNAVTGGLAGLIFFTLILSRSFGEIGRLRQRLEGTRREASAWALGAALFANAVAFIGIAYFDQSIIYWFATLAIICAATEHTAVQPAETLAAASPFDSVSPVAVLSSTARKRVGVDRQPRRFPAFEQTGQWHGR